MKSDSSGFIKLMLILSKLLASLEDKFFITKINLATEDLLESYILLRKESNVAQYKEAYTRFSFVGGKLLDILDCLEHANALKTSYPLLVIEKYLFEIRLNILSTHHESKQTLSSREQSVDFFQKDKPRLSSNKEKILNFIKQSNSIRTKDIIGEFSSLSERTVKRSLKELITEGLVRKKEENKAVYYFTS